VPNFAPITRYNERYNEKSQLLDFVNFGDAAF